MPKCNEQYGCGGDMPSSFTVTVEDFNNPNADDDGMVDVQVCRDCAATGEWA